jgi:hypothetical protein
MRNCVVRVSTTVSLDGNQPDGEQLSVRPVTGWHASGRSTNRGRDACAINLSLPPQSYGASQASSSGACRVLSSHGECNMQGIVQSAEDQVVMRQRPKSFLEGLRLDHGPIGDIGRFLLTAEAVVRSRGITLSFARAGELRELQEKNAKSWPLLAPWMNGKAATLPAAWSPHKVAASIGSAIALSATLSMIMR